ncbi:MAG: hypothetical protein BroJett020_02110 [Bacteroidota bacterium]|nr:MAG: hypothetical protein BroJett020_02110 [Bacteroidota bacterium]
MANLHSQFKKYEERISLSPTQKDLIVKRHSALRTVITNYFKQKNGISVPDFFIQGSYKMNTMVQKKDGSFDVDLGVFFPQKPSLTPTTMQSYILDAVKNQTTSGAQHLKKCIRVNYVGEFNADLPVYYQVDTNSQAYIAVKNGNWVKDDPEKFINWVTDNRKSKEISNDGQLLRVIKYLKRWANLQSFKTPSGVALTVWVCKNFKAIRDRDDEALSKTINEMHSNFWLTISCQCPVEPFDDLLSNLDSSQKDKFKEALGKLKGDAAKALSTSDTNLAVSYWAKHLGNKYTV